MVPPMVPVIHDHYAINTKRNPDFHIFILLPGSRVGRSEANKSVQHEM